MFISMKLAGKQPLNKSAGERKRREKKSEVMQGCFHNYIQMISFHVCFASCFLEAWEFSKCMTTLVAFGVNYFR